MNAIVIHAAHDLRIEDRPAGNPGPGEVRLHMARGGICGSDLHYYHDGGFGNVRLREPMVLGHEVAGHVAELGPGVDGLNIGQLVALSPSRPCGSCGFCQTGQQNHCENMRFYGSAMPFPHSQGAFRTGIVALASQCIPADELTPAEAAMAEPLAVVLHAITRAGSLLGRTVLVTGCGPIGLLTVLAVRRAGAGRIVATDLAAFALGMARDLGADQVIDMAHDPGAFAALTAGKGQVDVMFECSGAAIALTGGTAAMRPRGIIVQVGVGGDIAVPMSAITGREIDLRGSFRFHAEYAVAVRMMQARLIEVAPLVTHVMPLAQARAAFDLASDRARAMKVQIAFAQDV